MDWENMEILDSARDDHRLRNKKMLIINKLKPELNVQLSYLVEKKFWKTF